MSNYVPATTAIRRSRVCNIGNDRLIRRQHHLLDMLVESRQFSTRMNFAVRAAELWEIERELVTRGVFDTEGITQCRNVVMNQSA